MEEALGGNLGTHLLPGIYIYISLYIHINKYIYIYICIL